VAVKAITLLNESLPAARTEIWDTLLESAGLPVNAMPSMA
jgi:hypothetical protein